MDLDYVIEKSFLYEESFEVAIIYVAYSSIIFLQFVNSAGT